MLIPFFPLAESPYRILKMKGIVPNSLRRNLCLWKNVPSRRRSFITQVPCISQRRNGRETPQLQNETHRLRKGSMWQIADGSRYGGHKCYSQSSWSPWGVSWSVTLSAISLLPAGEEFSKTERCRKPWKHSQLVRVQRMRVYGTPIYKWDFLHHTPFPARLKKHHRRGDRKIFWASTQGELK